MEEFEWLERTMYIVGGSRHRGTNHGASASLGSCSLALILVEEEHSVVCFTRRTRVASTGASCLLTHGGEGGVRV